MAKGDVETSRPRAAALLSGASTASFVSTAFRLAAVRPLWVLPVPAKGVTSASASYNLVALKHSRRLDIWALALDREGGKAGTDNCQLALRVEMQSPEHIQCVPVTQWKYCVLLKGTDSHVAATTGWWQRQQPQAPGRQVAREGQAELPGSDLQRGQLPAGAQYLQGDHSATEATTTDETRGWR